MMLPFCCDTHATENGCTLAPVMRATLAALFLLLAPGIAAAVCFQHPDTGRTHCDYAFECPQGTAWTPRQVCEPSMPTTPAPTCTGTDSGSYTPSSSVFPEVPVSVSPMRAHWSRVGPVVSVAGKALYAVGVDQLEVRVDLDLPIAAIADFTSPDDVVGTWTSLYDERSGQVWNIAGGRSAALILVNLTAGVRSGVLHYSYHYRIAGC